MHPKQKRLQKFSHPPQKVEKKSYHIFPNFEKPMASTGFPIDAIVENKKLMNNVKYARLAKNISTYNENLKKYGEENIIKYKLFEFLHSSLCICNTKTSSEIDTYLDFIENWFSKFNTKAGLSIIQKKAKFIGKQQEAIRQTFRSNLPFEINEYKRRILDAQLTKEDSDLVSQEKSFESSSEQLSLPVFCVYQNQILKARKQRQDKEESALAKYLKKNNSRIQSHTTKNFYRLIQNRHDILQPKAEVINRQHTSTLDQLYGTKYNFSQIKRNKLQKIYGIKKTIRENPTQYVGQLNIQNIDGLCLIKNHTEIPKKKGKKPK